MNEQTAALNYTFDIRDDELLTIQEVADRLKVSRRTFEKNKKNGMAPTPVFVDGRELYPTSHVNAYIAKQNPHTIVAPNAALENAAAAAVAASMAVSGA